MENNIGHDLGTSLPDVNPESLVAEVRAELI